MFKYSVMGSMGFSVFNNAGFVVIVIIYVQKWYAGEHVDSEEAFSMLAMVFYLFIAVNMMLLFAFSTVNQLQVLFERLGDVFRMEEHHHTRDEACSGTPDCGV
jgi:hypothetical protein